MSPAPEPPRPAAPEDDPVEASRMTLAEHLDELRQRLLRATAAFAIAFVALWSFRAEVSRFITRPYDQAMEWLNDDLAELFAARVAAGEDAALYFEPGYPARVDLRDSARIETNLTQLGFGSNMIMRLRVSFWLALFVAGPFALYQAWAFVAAGLYRNEKKLVLSYFPASVLLFLGGVAFGFFLLIPYAAYFLSKEGLGEPNFNLTVTNDTYLQFIKALSLAVGVVFQMPLVQFVLSRLGLVDPVLYGQYRGHMAVGTLVVAAILTPPDPVTQLMLAIPALLLYEIGAVIARLVWVPVPGALPANAGAAPTGATR